MSDITLQEKSMSKFQFCKKNCSKSKNLVGFYCPYLDAHILNCKVIEMDCDSITILRENKNLEVIKK